MADKKKCNIDINIKEVDVKKNLLSLLELDGFLLSGKSTNMCSKASMKR